ncbi:hypothetical protein C8F01DRAFT_1300848, partial [Mycena amicta]
GPHSCVSPFCPRRTCPYLYLSSIRPSKAPLPDSHRCRPSHLLNDISTTTWPFGGWLQVPTTIPLRFSTGPSSWTLRTTASRRLERNGWRRQRDGNETEPTVRILRQPYQLLRRKLHEWRSPCSHSMATRNWHYQSHPHIPIFSKRTISSQHRQRHISDTRICPSMHPPDVPPPFQALACCPNVLRYRGCRLEDEMQSFAYPWALPLSDPPFGARPDGGRVFALLNMVDINAGLAGALVQSWRFQTSLLEAAWTVSWMFS